MAVAVEQDVTTLRSEVRCQIALVRQPGDVFLERDGLIGDDLGSRIARQQVEIFIPQGQQAAWLQPNQRQPGLGRGQQGAHGSLGRLAGHIDQPLGDRRAAVVDRQRSNDADPNRLQKLDRGHAHLGMVVVREWVDEQDDPARAFGAGKTASPSPPGRKRDASYRRQDALRRQAHAATRPSPQP